MLKSGGLSPPTLFFFFLQECFGYYDLNSWWYSAPKITMTLFNDTDERDDYEIRNDEFVGFHWAVAYAFCVTTGHTSFFMWKSVWFLEMTPNHYNQFGEWDEIYSTV